MKIHRQKNENEIDAHYRYNNFGSSTADSILNQNNPMIASNNKEMSEANKMSFNLNFDLALSSIETENEDDEVQILLINGTLRKQFWPDNETNTECSGEDVLSKLLMFRKTNIILQE